MMSLNVYLNVVWLVCSNLYTNFFLYSKFVHEFLKFRVRIFAFVLISYVNCTHEIQNFEKVHTNSREFVIVMLKMVQLPGERFTLPWWFREAMGCKHPFAQSI